MLELSSSKVDKSIVVTLFNSFDSVGKIRRERREFLQQHSISAFNVKMFDCLEIPRIFYDDLISNDAYLPSFHFQMQSDRCDLDYFVCHLNMKRSVSNFSSSIVQTTTLLNETIEIVIDYPSSIVEKRTNYFIDQIHRKTIVHTAFLEFFVKISRQATCTNLNRQTGREFQLHVDEIRKNQSTKSNYRTDLILCRLNLSSSDDECEFFLYQYDMKKGQRRNVKTLIYCFRF